LGSREVGGRFGRRNRGRLRVARLRAGRNTGLEHGVNQLEVRVRDRRGVGDYEVVRFALVRRAPRLLGLGGPRRSARRALVRLRLERKRAAVSLRVNGRRVRLPASARPGRRLRVVRLAGDERLRHGRNRLRVTAVDRLGGRFAVKRRTLFIRRTAPIPAAGHSRRALTRRRVRLDASNTRAAKLPPSLRYRWRIVRKPRGSHPKLRGANTRRPRLRPDLPGRYRLRMTVTERTPGAASARAAASATAAASDTTTISATPDGGGIGVAVNTMDQGRVTVGDQHYAPPDASKPLQLVVLDRQTLARRSNQSFAGDEDGTEALGDTVFALASDTDKDTIAIIATRGNGAAPISDVGDSLNNLNAAVAELGGRPIPAAVAQTATSCAKPTPVCSGFSVIGTPGFGVGEGKVNPGLGALNGAGAGGALTGYLQLSQTTPQRFTFVQGDHVAFDTSAPSTEFRPGATATIKIGDVTYSSQPLYGDAGAYVLVLDAGTLALRDQGTYILRHPDADKVVAGEQQMAAMLEKYKDDPSALVFVQSIGLLGRQDGIGDPYRGDLPDGWNRIAQALQTLGVHRSLFNGLGPEQGRSGSYAQVAPGGPSAASWAKVASQLATRTEGQLTGTLARNDSAQFYADNASGMDESADDLTVVAYQPPAPGGWPLRDTARYRAALNCVAKAVPVLKYPIEESYDDLNITWNAGLLDGVTYDSLAGKCDTSSFNSTDFDKVTAQLADEFNYVGAVRGMIGQLQATFGYVNESSQLNLQKVADDINASVAAPQAAPVSYDGLAIGEEVLYVVGALASVAGQEEVAVATELVAAGLGLVDDTTLDKDGTPALSQNITDADVNGFAIDLNDRFVQAVKHFAQIGDILVGDWGKLQTAGTNAGANGPWSLSDDETTQVGNAVTFAGRRFAYTALFPKAYPWLLRGAKGDATIALSDDASQYTCWYYPWAGGGDPIHLQTEHRAWRPFGGTQEGGGVTPTPVLGAGAPTERENWVFSAAINADNAIAPAGNIAHDWAPPALPSGTLLSQMFYQNAAEVLIPPLQPLEFVLSIRDQLTVLSVSHTSSTFRTEDGSLEQNVCLGKVSRWSDGL
jgi:hypothetical protein